MLSPIAAGFVLNEVKGLSVTVARPYRRGSRHIRMLIFFAASQQGGWFAKGSISWRNAYRSAQDKGSRVTQPHAQAAPVLQAAGDFQCGTGYIGRFVGGEEKGGVGDFFYCAEPFDRGHLFIFFHLLLWKVAKKVGLYETG